MAITVKVSGASIEKKLGDLQGTLPGALLAQLSTSLSAHYAAGNQAHFSAVVGTSGYVISVGKNKYMGKVGGPVPSLSAICAALGVVPVLTKVAAGSGQDAESVYEAQSSATQHKPAPTTLDLGASIFEDQKGSEAAKSGVFKVIKALPGDDSPVGLFGASALNQKVLATSSTSVYRVFVLGYGLNGAARYQGTTLSIRLEGSMIASLAGQLAKHGFTNGGGYMSTHISGVNSKAEASAILGWVVYLLQAVGVTINQALVGTDLGAGA